MTRLPLALLSVLLVLAVSSPATAQSPENLQQRIEAKLGEAGPGTRFGLVVATEGGRELVAIAPDARFIPASSTKVFTTAAAFATLAALDRSDAAGGTSVRLDPRGKNAPDVILTGRGDARMSSAIDCTVDCLATLADAVAVKARTVRDVVGDDSRYPDERWSAGMSWNNIPTRSGTAISALSLDDNVLTLRVTPAAPGQPPTLDLAPYYTVDNRATTVAGGTVNFGFDRLPFSNVVRLTGTIGADAAPELLRLGIDDPAHYAAWTLKRLLEARGVRVIGTVAVRHRPPMPTDDPIIRKGAPPVRAPQTDVLARLTPPPLADDLKRINKGSQNLYAELMLRRIGFVQGTGSTADGLAIVRAMLARAGVARTAHDLSDGSGMSTYNRVAPRGMVVLLRWISAQPWGAAWRDTLAIGGIDGTLSTAFRGTALQGRVFAKTGTLNATAALSGYMTAKSGRTLIFSAFANDIPDGSSATPAIEAALELVSQEY